MAKKPFDQWMAQVNEIVGNITQQQMDVDDLPDVDYAGWYEDGVGSQAAASRAVKNAGYVVRAAPQYVKQGQPSSATGQKGRIKREAQAKAQAEEFVATAVAQAADEPVASPVAGKPTKQRAGSYTFTAEDIVRVRDEQGLSWADTAATLELGSPGAARAAYTRLTGKPHTDSQMQGRRAPARRGDPTVRAGRRGVAVLRPEWTDETPQDDIADAIIGRTIFVERRPGFEEEMKVKTIKRFSGSASTEDQHGEVRTIPLTVEFVSDMGASRAIAVQKIKEVR